ncbi:asparaginase [Pseudogracilibacillus auburnensis]|uniref:asparaginase n=1 Tax=Pseudogracilibacillus auburnensis TaxID=1494959 RepID=UPI001A9723B3|nr:asparaginase [Pseudogracilibacillus auburnensis]MBO1001874.1 asparaginase [Pseudogracilibacillus auburnensis]
MSYPIIARDFRNHTLENTHQGVICIVNEDKETIYEKGDMEKSFFYRSAMKPLQAIPVFMSNVIEKYHLTAEETALFMASQRGEKYHEETLISLREKLDVDEKDLVCASSYPLNEKPKLEYVRANKSKRRLLHNCAGKHLGFLGYTKGKGLGIAGYEQLDHPLQQEIVHYLSEMSEVPVVEIVSGTDGCGVPVHAVPMKNMALSYLKFAVPELINDEKLRNAVVHIGEVMNAHPNIIASHDFVCSVLLKDSNIIAKGGAQGVYCLALRKEKISIALKVLSGTELIWPLLIAEILKKIDYRNEETISNLLQLRSENIVNDDGKMVGETKVYL